jgi:polysaccharide export outer membrane protein
MLIRDNGLERKSFLIDITNKKFIDSEAYYIKQNDVIIVSPNNPQIKASAFNRNMPLYIAVASTIISVIVLLTR